MRKFSKRIAVGATTVVAGTAIGLSGVAFGWWSSSGQGTGRATTDSANTTLSFTDTTNITDMAPGVAAEGISGTVSNASGNGQSAYVHQVVVSIDSVSETAAAKTAWGDPATSSAGTQGTYYCTAADYTLSNATMTVDQDLADGASANFSGATIGFHDLAADQDACQGATVNLKYVSN